MGVLYLSRRNEKGADKNGQSEKAFEKAKEYVSARIKIMWEEQHITSVSAL